MRFRFAEQRLTQTVSFAVSRLVRSGIFLLALAALVCAAPLPFCSAQDTHISHRRLELPEGGSPDVERQMQLLQLLQRTMRQPQSNPDDDGTGKASQSLDPEQWKRLSDMMKQLGGNIPPGMLPDPSSIPPGLLNEAMSNPQKRDQIRQMLEQFSRTRKFPSGGQGSSVLPPAPDATGNPPNGTTSVSPGNPTETLQERNQRQLNQARDVMNRWKDQFESLRQKFNTDPRNRSANVQPDGDDTSNNSQRPNSSNSQQQQQSATPPGNGSANGTASRGTPPPESDQEWSALLEKLIAAQRGQRPFDGGSNSTGSTSADPENNSAQRSGSQQNRGLLSGENLANWLKSLEGQQLPPLQPPPASPNGGSDTTAPSPSAQSKSTSNASTTEALQDRQSQIKAELARNGFQNTLKQIVRDAKQQAKAGQSAGNSNEATNGADNTTIRDGGLEAGLMRVLDGVREDIMEIAKDAKFKPSGNSPKVANKRREQRLERTGGAGNSTSAVKELRKSASEFFADIAAKEQTPASAEQPNAAADQPTTESGDSWLLTTVVLLSLVAIAVYLGRRLGVLGTSSESAGIMHVPHGSQIRTRADLIRAFHTMALQPTRNTQSWWTHSQVAEHVATTSPEKTQQIRVLSRLYEQARYLPVDAEFTDQQLQDAVNALKQCERS